MAKSVRRKQVNSAGDLDKRPTAERLQQGDVVTMETRDEAGWPVRRYQVVDTVARLTRNGMFDGEWTDAVERFRRDYRTAHYQSVGVRSLLRLQSSSGARPVDERIEDARERVSRAVARLGGLTSPMGSVVWDVIGGEMSLHAWCERQRLTAGRSFRHDVASGILIGAAVALAAYYATVPREGEPARRRRRGPEARC